MKRLCEFLKSNWFKFLVIGWMLWITTIIIEIEEEAGTSSYSLERQLEDIKSSIVSNYDIEEVIDKEMKEIPDYSYKLNDLEDNINQLSDKIGEPKGQGFTVNTDLSTQIHDIQSQVEQIKSSLKY